MLVELEIENKNKGWNSMKKILFQLFNYQKVYFLVIKYIGVNIIYLNTLSSKKQERISLFFGKFAKYF